MWSLRTCLSEQHHICCDNMCTASCSPLLHIGLTADCSALLLLVLHFSAYRYCLIFCIIRWNYSNVKLIFSRSLFQNSLKSLVSLTASIESFWETDSRSLIQNCQQVMEIESLLRSQDRNAGLCSQSLGSRPHSSAVFIYEKLYFN